MKPISAKEYESQEFKFPLKICAGIGGYNLKALGISEQDIVTAIEYAASDWSDGRYAFHIEGFNHHLTEIIRWAIQHILYTRNRDKYKNQMVITNAAGSQTSKACIVTEQQMSSIKHVGAAIEEKEYNG